MAKLRGFRVKPARPAKIKSLSFEGQRPKLFGRLVPRSRRVLREVVAVCFQRMRCYSPMRIVLWLKCAERFKLCVQLD